MNEVAINAAQVSISARLLHWGAPHAHERARELVDDLLRRGWIPPSEATPAPARHRPGEFAPDKPIPSAEAIERIKRLRAIVRDNPPPPEKD